MGKAFNPTTGILGHNAYEDAKLLALGVLNYLEAMMDEGNANDYASTSYLYWQMMDRVVQLKYKAEAIKAYIK